MPEKFEILRRCPLFEGIGVDQIRSMLGCIDARVTEARRGEAILREDSPAEFVGILLEGEARIVRNDIYGNRTIQAVLAPGDLFGESFACAGVERVPVTVEAVKPSRIMRLRLRRVLEVCSSACAFHNRMVANLLRAIAAKNLQLNEKLEITSRRTTREKLMAYLTLQARRAGSNRFTISLDRQGLADYLGVERSALSAEIGRLRREGVLESARSTFHLLGVEP